MSDRPKDPAQDTVDQTKRHDEGFKGQEGYGVQYEQQRFQGDDVQPPPETGRTGSYETGNTAGYGHTDSASESSVVPPDPEAQQGQGGQ
jgi:hypothetical protein